MESTGVVNDELVGWLLAGDPAIRWQVMRDLLGEHQHAWLTERERVARVGWGAQLLGFQDATGRWTPRLYGYKWISTTYSMVLLRRLGLAPRHPKALAACDLFLEEGIYQDGGINLSTGQQRSEMCLTGMVLGLLAWFGVTDERRELLVEFLVNHQMVDGGWNCEWDRGAEHSSLHTTISVLEGLREYAFSEGRNSATTERAEHRGREFMAEHHLFRSHRTGAVVDEKMLMLSFPPRWKHDILRGLDYFQSAGAPRDSRLTDAVDVLIGKRRRDGTWPLQHRHPGRTWFDMEQPGKPSRWNTLRALRVLKWWHQPPPDAFV